MAANGALDIRGSCAPAPLMDPEKIVQQWRQGWGGEGEEPRGGRLS